MTFAHILCWSSRSPAASFLCAMTYRASLQLFDVLRFCAAVSRDTRLHQALYTVHWPTAERAYRLLVNALCTTCALRSTALACARFLLDTLGQSMTPPRSDVVRACAPQSSRTCLHYGLARGCVVLEAPRRWRRLRGLAVLASALTLGLFFRASAVLPPPPQPCALPSCARPQETIYVRRTAL